MHLCFLLAELTNIAVKAHRHFAPKRLTWTHSPHVVNTTSHLLCTNFPGGLECSNCSLMWRVRCSPHLDFCLLRSFI